MPATHPDSDHGKLSYAVELHVRGVIHIQIERLPPVIATILTTAVASLLTWLTTSGMH